MGKIVQRDFSKRVATVLERDQIPLGERAQGMVVTVANAIDDVDAGTGVANYVWDMLEGWILISKSTEKTLSFENEKLTISNGQVQLSNIPVDSKIWGCQVIGTDNLIVADLDSTQLDTVSELGKVKGIPAEYNGMLIKVAYAYGTITQQLNAIFEAQEAATTTEVI